MQATPDNVRRQLLRRLTTLMFLFGIVAVAIPFFSSLSTTADPSVPIMSMDLADMRAAELRSVVWNGWPVYILKRSPAMLESLRQPDERLADPRSANSSQPDGMKNSYRSRSPDYLVVYLGCEIDHCPVEYRSGKDIPGNFPQGALFCSCGGSVYDLAGRVYRGMPDEKNLAVPDYSISSAGVLRLGDAE
jgi:ubiquinol-cytochrome c reductase iron-sulfur subunit